MNKSKIQNLWQSLKQKSLKQQLQFWGLILVIIPSLIIACLYFYFEKSYNIEEKYREFTNLASVQQHIIDQWVNNKQASIRGFSDLVAHNQQENEILYTKLQKFSKTHPEFQFINIFDTNGELRVSSLGEINAVNIQDRKHFKEAMQGKECSGEFITARSSGLETVIFSVPLFTEDGEVSGVLVGGIDPKSILSIIQDYKFGITGQTYLIDYKGNLISQNSMQAGYNNKSANIERIKDTQGYQQAFTSSSGVLFYTNYQGVEVLGGYQWTDNGKFLILGEVERSEIMADFWDRIAVMGTLYLLVVMLVVPLSIWISNRLKRPIDQLIYASEQVRQGNYNYKIPEKKINDAPIEMRELCDTYYKMTQTVNNSIKLLEMSNRALANSELKYRTLVEKSLVGVYIISNGTYVYVNPKFTEYFEYSEDEVFELGFQDLVLAEDWPIFEKIMADYLNGIEYQSATGLRCRTKTGRIIYVETLGAPILYQGAPAIIGTVKDITKRKEAELILEHYRNYLEEIVEKRTAELEHSRNVIANILESISDAFMSLDWQFNIIYVNKQAERILGRSRPYLNEQDFWSVFPILKDTKFYQKAHEAMEDHIHVSCEEYLEAFQTWVEIQLYPSSDGLSVYIRDITEQKQAEAKAKRREQEYKTLVENIPDIVERMDQDLRHVYVNPAVCEVFGFEPDDYFGKTHTDLGIPNEVARLIDDEVKKVFESRKSCSFEYTVTDTNRHYLCHLVPEFLTGNEIQYVLSITRDITKLKKMEKELVRLDRLHIVGEMAAGIGHEVRNPMTTVRGFLQMLTNKKECKPYRSYFQLMIDELDRANAIISEFLSLAKDRSLHIMNLNLNDIISILFPLIQADAFVGNKRVDFIKGDVIDLPLDEKEIRQLLLNLARNGLEAMSEGGTLTIETYQEKDTVILAVRDQGPGIPPEVVDKLGTPFFTTKENGNGLGLAVCFSVAEKHNADISVDTGPEGTNFFVKFKVISLTQECSEV